MTGLVFALVLAAALLHATWNALLRGGGDRLWSMTVMSFVTTAIAVPWALLVKLPAAAAWPWLGASALLQLGYSLFLVQAYRFGGLGHVYPVARGTAPLLVTLLALLLAHDRPGVPALVGIALVSGGLFSLARGVDRASRRALLLALTTGAFIAAYTTVDGIGVRLAGTVGSYAAWLFLLYGALMPASFFLLRGRRWPDVPPAETFRALLGGGLSLLTYGIVVFALARAPIAAVSALRETSVVFAALLGHLFLGERLTARKLAACVVIALGTACIGWQR